MMHGAYNVKFMSLLLNNVLFSLPLHSKFYKFWTKHKVLKTLKSSKIKVCPY